MKPIPVGAKGTHSKTVEQADLASHLDASLAAVMSTPTMVAMMEQAAIEAIKPFIDTGESSVGMSIEVSHTAATPPGHLVRAEAEVTKVEGRQAGVRGARVRRGRTDWLREPSSRRHRLREIQRADQNKRKS